MLDFVPIEYYKVILYATLFTICLFTSLYYQSGPGCDKLMRKGTIILPFLLAILLTLYIGLRESNWYFWDMMLYKHLWNVVDATTYEIQFDLRSEWFFMTIIVLCKIAVNDAQFFFFIAALIYVGCHFWVCKRLLWENVWLAVLFVFFSFQFYAYATNGIRNGLAAAIMLLAISFFSKRNTMGYLWGFILFILAFGCHRSIILPMAALMISTFVVKDIKYSVAIWLSCILISLFVGNAFLNFLSSIGFDERIASYASSMERESTRAKFSHIGFRWDFLLYSAMPVWIAWYVRYKGIFDRTFYLIANTYILANSIWILLIRVSFTNRFAYLSWFLYALVIAYAVIRIPIWKNQDRVAGQILLAHSFFTIFMFIIGK